MKEIIWILLNGVGLLIGIGTWFLLCKRRTVYPDMRVGYHMDPKSVTKEEWEQCNDIAGLFSLGFSITAFLAIPVLLYFFSVSVTMRLMVCCVSALLLALGGVFLPLLFLRKKRGRKP